MRETTTKTGSGTALAYFGHHKCATKWIIGHLRSVCRRTGLTFGRISNARCTPSELRDYIRRNEVDLLACSNATPALSSCPSIRRGFHVIRDPRDICVSAYFSHLHSHAARPGTEMEHHRNKLRTLDQESGLSLEIRHCAWQFRALYDWDYTQSHVLELRMEEMAAEPLACFQKLLQFLGLMSAAEESLASQIRSAAASAVNRLHSLNSTFPRWRVARIGSRSLAGVVHRHRFQRKSGGRKPGQEDAHSHYRKGVPRDWVNHFSERHKDEFKNLYGDLVVKLGYEQSNDW